MICKIINSSGTIVESGDLHKLCSTARPTDSTCNPVHDSAQNEAQHDVCVSVSHVERLIDVQARLEVESLGSARALVDRAVVTPSS